MGEVPPCDEAQDSNAPAFWMREATDQWDYHDRFVRPYEFEAAGKRISLRQLPIHYGSTVWDSALVLSKYIDNERVFPKGYWASQDVLELGSGTGLVGIVAALLGARVCLTDQQQLLPLIAENVKKNVLAHSSRTTVSLLKWGEKMDAFCRGQFDCVIAADVLYAGESVPALIETLVAVTRGPRPCVVYLAYCVRDMDGESYFWSEAPKHFDIVEVPTTELHETYRHATVKVLTLRRSGSRDPGVV